MSSAGCCQPVRHSLGAVGSEGALTLCLQPLWSQVHVVGMSLALVALGRWQKEWCSMDTGHVSSQVCWPCTRHRGAFPQGGGQQRQGQGQLHLLFRAGSFSVPTTVPESWCWGRLALPSWIPELQGWEGEGSTQLCLSLVPSLEPPGCPGVTAQVNVPTVHRL